VPEATSTKPYLLRAIYDWCADNGFTPYIAVVVDEGTLVPREFVKNGEIVLNIGALATSHFVLGNEMIEFQARFGGATRSISVPIHNVNAIYARENGQGMAFEVVANQGQGHDAPAVPAPPQPDANEQPVAHTALAQLKPVAKEGSPAPSSAGTGGKPRLTIVK